MKIDILISTYNNGIYRIKDLLLSPDPDINYIISHQITDSDLDISSCNFLCRSDVRYYQLFDKGISRNRNNTVINASGDICFIADDDVKYDIAKIKSVAQKFQTNPDIDVFVGKIETYENEPAYKNYSSHEKYIGWMDIGSVSSIEMVIKRDSIVKNGIKFDERFGLGSSLYKKGEEAIFLSDCLKKKLKIKYFPQYIVKHPKESSASSVVYDKKETEYMGALNYRIFRNKAFLTAPLFSLKHYKRYKNYLSLIEYFKYFDMGIKNMKQNEL